MRFQAPAGVTENIICVQFDSRLSELIADDDTASLIGSICVSYRFAWFQFDFAVWEEWVIFLRSDLLDILTVN